MRDPWRLRDASGFLRAGRTVTRATQAFDGRARKFVGVAALFRGDGGLNRRHWRGRRWRGDDRHGNRRRGRHRRRNSPGNRLFARLMPPRFHGNAGGLHRLFSGFLGCRFLEDCLFRDTLGLDARLGDVGDARGRFGWLGVRRCSLGRSPGFGFRLGRRNRCGDRGVRAWPGDDVMIDDVGPDDGCDHRRQYVQSKFRDVFQHDRPLPAPVLMLEL